MVAFILDWQRPPYNGKKNYSLYLNMNYLIKISLKICFRASILSRRISYFTFDLCLCQMMKYHLFRLPMFPNKQQIRHSREKTKIEQKYISFIINNTRTAEFKNLSLHVTFKLCFWYLSFTCNINSHTLNNSQS